MHLSESHSLENLEQMFHTKSSQDFCIPHGGGGPGVGPVAVAEHLSEYLPSHPLAPDLQSASIVGSVSGAPWGSAGILPISWAYIAMMGAEGLRLQPNLQF